MDRSSPVWAVTRCNPPSLAAILTTTAGTTVANGATLGLTRDTARGETEDHVSYGFEVMRYLIAGDDAAVCNLEQQRRFFRAQLQPWVEALLSLIHI